MHIDLWTLALQAANVLVLVWLLSRFLFRPVTAIIAARRAAADAVLAEATATRAKAEATAADLARQRAGLAGEGEKIAAEARAAAEAERATLLHQAADAGARLRAEAANAIEHDRQSMRETLEHEASELAVAIARRLAERVPQRALTRAFLDGLSEALSAYPAPDSLVGVPLELSTAVALDAAEESAAREILAKVVNADPDVTFHVDPGLIAGFELSAPHAIIRLSWRSDLDRITQLLLSNHHHNAEAQPVA